MSRYLSPVLISAAYRRLEDGGVSAIDLSALRYCLAFDAFIKEFGRDCSLKENPEDKESFIEFVKDVVGIDSNLDGSPSYICDFKGSKPRKTLHDQVSSNFITANAVRQSRGKIGERYPSKPTRYLFMISNEVLDASSINYGHIGCYLPDSDTRAAFAVWVSRYDELVDDLPCKDALAKSLRKRYSSDLVNALLEDLDDGCSLLGVPDEDKYGSMRPEITWELLSRDSSAGHRSDAVGLSRNWIFFGAPGTGKSYQLNQLAKESFAKDNISRVTFYPDYTYSQFVGCYKPSTDENGAITYAYVAGPFLDTYLDACTHPYDQYVLIIEEINRANPAAVFGDVFQLLDRRADGWSEYSVGVSDDMKKFIVKRLSKMSEEERNSIETYYDPDMDFADFSVSMENSMALPPNMYIWATMNSADQGVFPMDTAFKRRWDFRYMGIDEGENVEIDGVPLNEIEVPCGQSKIVWNDLRHAINQFMLSDDIRVNEDKLLGPFFISPSALKGDRFNQVFKDKVLLYLYEDAGKMKRSRLFRHELKTYSEICKYFDEHGRGIFGQGFDDRFAFGADGVENKNGSEA